MTVLTTAPLSAEQLNKLEELARAATSGPWLHRHDPGNPPGVQHGVKLPGENGTWIADFLDNADRRTEGGNAGERNAAFVAAANPATILALIAQARAASQALPPRPVGEQDERALFEAWAQGQVTSLVQGKFGTGYVYADALRAWEAWQARAAVSTRASSAPADGLRPKREMPPEMKAAIEEAHKTGASGALLPNGSAVFINYGHDYGDNDHLCCTACGGYGHIEDQQVRAGQQATPASAQPADEQAALDAQLRQEVTAMYQLLDDGEWGEHIARTRHGQHLETAITRLVGKLASAQPVEAAPAGFVLMPKRLTAENGAKGALSGEFKESIRVTCPECDGSGEMDDEIDCGECNGEGTVEQTVAVGWDTIKDIYKAAVALLAAAAPAAPVAQAEANAAGLPDPAEEMLDMLGRVHPFAMEKGDREKAYERLERAFVIQQPWPVPDQACIVWRADLMDMRYDLVQKQAYFDSNRASRATTAPVAPQGAQGEPATAGTVAPSREKDAPAEDAKDAARFRWIEENCRTEGGGHGFTIFVPVDAEDIGCGIDAAMSASQQGAKEGDAA